MAVEPEVLIAIGAGSFVLIVIIAVLVIWRFTKKKKVNNSEIKENVNEIKAGVNVENRIIKQEKIKTGIKEVQKEDKPIFQIDTSNVIPSLPEIPDLTKVDIKYPLIAPYAFAHIHWDRANTELVYDIEEPVLDAKEKENLETLEDGIRELINLSYISVKDKNTILIYLEKNVKILLTELSIQLVMDSYLKIMYYIYRDFVGLNEMEPLLNDYYIEDIECNGTNSPLYVVHRKYRNIRTNLIYKDIHKLASFVEKLAQKAGKYVSYAEPLLDGTLPDGSIDYNELVIYKENSIVKVNKIGEVVDKCYDKKESNKPIYVDNIEVAAFDKDYKIKWKKVDYVYRHSWAEDLYELGMEFGRKIKLTGCHSIFVLRSDGVKSERTENLREGDYVVLPSLIPENNVIKEINLAKELAHSEYKKKLIISNVPDYIFIKYKKELCNYYKLNYKQSNQAYYEHKNKKIIPVELYTLLSEEELRKCFIRTTSQQNVPVFLTINKELMWFLGLYAAEGWLYDYSSHGVYFCLNKNEINLIEEIRRAAKKCFNLNIYVESPKDGGIKIKVDGLILWLIMKNVLKVKEGAKFKRVPEIIFNVSKELQKEFIKSWHVGDYSTTISKTLADEISYLALFNQDIAAFYKSKAKTAIIKGRIINNFGTYYSNFYARNADNPYSSMMPIEVFNPLYKTHFRLKNRRIEKERLLKILNEIRYKRFENLNIANKKFILEWERRGIIKNNKLTDEGLKLVEEIDIVKKLINSDFCFAKINKINMVKSTSDYVYDFSVNGDENFIAGFGGICCHNSRVNATYTTDISSKGPTYCFSGGYLQLGDGNVVKIEKLFENFKKRFGYKNENGNEVVEAINMNCIGVDENNLNQQFSKLKTIIKLRPPEKLVEIKFADGGKIKTTTNHLFHIFDNGLKTIEAAKLKESLIVPMPSKVDVEGCIQTVNAYSLIQEFSYSHKVCICANQEIKNLARNLILNNGRKELTETYEISNSYFYEIVSRGNSIFFEVLDKACENLKVNKNSLSNLKLVVYGGGSKGKEKAIAVPEIIDEGLAYLAGAVISDGHLSENSVDIACYNKGFLEAAKKAFEDKFKQTDTCYNGNRICLNNKFAPFYFNKVFGIPYGKKCGIVKVPEIIFKSDNKVVCAFIKGLFDGDGTCSSGLSYKTNSKELAEELSYLLVRIGIYCYLNEDKGQYKLTIPSLYTNTFYNKIGFNDSAKKDRLANLISKKTSDREYNRYGRIPAKPFLDLMKKNGISKNYIAKKLNVSYNRMIYYDSFSREFASNILSLVENEKKPEEDINKLKWFIDCKQEFVKIESVNIIENKDQLNVYDIELSPCKFFIAGNKPMNIFDTVRKFTKEPWSPVQLLQKGTASAEILAYVWMCIEYENSFMVIGGTGSGKTSFLNAVAFFIPPQARIVSIEDTRELSLEHENWLPSVSRAGVGLTNILGQRYGEVSLFDLLKESFRQRPDYIIVGEVRGAEAYILFQGMASGHPSMGTMHAESVETMVRRLETPPINLSGSLIMSIAAVFVQAQTKVKGKEVRRMSSVDEVIDVKEKTEGGSVKSNNVFKWNPANDTFVLNPNSHVFENIAMHYGFTKGQVFNEFKLRAALLKELNRRGIIGFKEVQKIIHEYYKEPAAVLRRFNLIK